MKELLEILDQDIKFSKDRILNSIAGVESKCKGLRLYIDDGGDNCNSLGEFQSRIYEPDIEIVQLNNLYEIRQLVRNRME